MWRRATINGYSGKGASVMKEAEKKIEKCTENGIITDKSAMMEIREALLKVSFPELKKASGKFADVRRSIVLLYPEMGGFCEDPFDDMTYRDILQITDALASEYSKPNRYRILRDIAAGILDCAAPVVDRFLSMSAGVFVKEFISEEYERLSEISVWYGFSIDDYTSLRELLNTAFSASMAPWEFDEDIEEYRDVTLEYMNMIDLILVRSMRPLIVKT